MNFVSNQLKIETIEKFVRDISFFDEAKFIEKNLS